LPRRLATIVATLTLAGLAVVLPAAAANAQVDALRDTRGDMWRWSGVADPTPAPHSTVGDIRRAVLAHASARIAVRVSYVDLRRAGVYANYTLRLRTPGHVYREVTLETSRRHPAGRVRVFRRNGRPVADCGTRHRVDYDRSLVRISVARSCLGTPRTVQALFTGYRADADGDFLGDNPHNDRPRGAWTGWLASGR
jgi:hypothetical protein